MLPPLAVFLPTRRPRFGCVALAARCFGFGPSTCPGYLTPTLRRGMMRNTTHRTEDEMHRHDPALGICPDCRGAHCTQCTRGPLATNADTLCFDHTPGLTREERAAGFNNATPHRTPRRLRVDEIVGIPLAEAIGFDTFPHPLTDQAWLTKMRRAGKP